MAQMLAAVVGRNLHSALSPVRSPADLAGVQQPRPSLPRSPQVDVNFASIMDLDAGGGLLVVRLATDGRMAAAEPAALKVLQQFFPNNAVGLGHLPQALAGRLLESSNWGLSQAVRRYYDCWTVTRSGLRLTVHFIPESGGGYLLLKTEREPPGGGDPLAMPLTDRERQVVAFVAIGKTNIEIGSLLCISPRTVQKHLENIFRKLGVETRTAVAVRAMVMRPSLAQ